MPGAVGLDANAESDESDLLEPRPVRVRRPVQRFIEEMQISPYRRSVSLCRFVRPFLVRRPYAVISTYDIVVKVCVN